VHEHGPFAASRERFESPTESNPRPASHTWLCARPHSAPAVPGRGFDDCLRTARSPSGPLRICCAGPVTARRRERAGAATARAGDHPRHRPRRPPAAPLSASGAQGRRPRNAVRAEESDPAGTVGGHVGPGSVSGVWRGDLSLHAGGVQVGKRSEQVPDMQRPGWAVAGQNPEPARVTPQLHLHLTFRPQSGPDLVARRVEKRVVERVGCIRRACLAPAGGSDRVAVVGGPAYSESFR